MAYAKSFEHLSDELARLDLLIHLRLLKQRAQQPATAPDGYKGLVLWDEEIDGLFLQESLSQGGAPRDDFDLSLHPLAGRLAELATRIEREMSDSLTSEVCLPLARLSELFNLNSFEERCLIICLAPELDRKYEKLYAYLQDDVTRKKPSIDLVLDLLCRDAEERLEGRAAFDARSPLVGNGLLRVIDDPVDAPTPLIARSLKADDRIVGFMLDDEKIDERLAPFARLISPASVAREDTTDGAVIETLLRFITSPACDPHQAAQNTAARNTVAKNTIAQSPAAQNRAARKAALYFFGPYGSGRLEMAEAICRSLNMPLLVVDAERMLEDATLFDEFARLACREALLQRAALCVENFDALVADNGKRRAQLNSLLAALGEAGRLTFLLGEKEWKPQGVFGERLFIAQEFRVPGDRARQTLWKRGLAPYGHAVSDEELSALADKFRFTPGQIRDAIFAAQAGALLRSPDGAINISDLYAASRAQTAIRLGVLARKIEPFYRWDELVLPDDQTAQLREICEQVKTRHIVYGDWGFDRKLSMGKGLNVLFSGPPGTGKTMAAEIIANELGLDLYRIDLSQVVSKYIGETEKNLGQIFREARANFAILFFDEADALFGKRSEVKDSHDRYANIEIGYLLQEMESYDGIAILATNLRQHMDEAFVRRLQVIVEFPFPDEQHRERIWRVTFPQQAPLSEDVDFARLARDIKLAGGNIKNIVLAAAFYAASDGGVIGMTHLLEATRREYQKLGWPWGNAELERQAAYAS